MSFSLRIRGERASGTGRLATLATLASAIRQREGGTVSPQASITER
ncbi:hypothetical protein [Streptomyces sp. NBC_01233]|nr:hypothetical protein OG332_13855 [Streptomyces sp. NBC_01233]